MAYNLPDLPRRGGTSPLGVLGAWIGIGSALGRALQGRNVLTSAEVVRAVTPLFARILPRIGVPGRTPDQGPLPTAVAGPVVPFPSTAQRTKKATKPAPTSSPDDSTWNTREQLILKALERLAQRYPWAAYLWRLYLAGSIVMVMEDIRQNHEKYWRDYVAWENQQARTEAPVIRAPAPGRIPRRAPRRTPPGGHSRIPSTSPIELPTFPTVLEPVIVTVPRMPTPAAMPRAPRARPAPAKLPELEPVIVTAKRLPVPAPVPRVPTWRKVLTVAGPYIERFAFPSKPKATQVKLKGFPGLPDSAAYLDALTRIQASALQSPQAWPQPATATAAKCKCPTKRKKSGKPTCRNPRVGGRTYTKGGARYRSIIRRLDCS